jgi:hypothetical protein
VKILRGPRNFLKKWHFLAKKSKISSKKPLGRGRVVFNKKFVGGEGILKAPPPQKKIIM